MHFRHVHSGAWNLSEKDVEIEVSHFTGVAKQQEEQEELTSLI